MISTLLCCQNKAVYIFLNLKDMVLKKAFYEDFRKQFSNTLMNLDKANLSRNTIKKNVISDIRKMHVLPDDRNLILEILDITLQKMDRIENFYPCIALHRGISF